MIKLNSISEFVWVEGILCHVSGNSKDGIGIYEEEDTTFFGNIICQGNETIGFGPYKTLEEAKIETVKEYNKMIRDI